MYVFFVKLKYLKKLEQNFKKLKFQLIWQIFSTVP